MFLRDTGLLAVRGCGPKPLQVDNLLIIISSLPTNPYLISSVDELYEVP